MRPGMVVLLAALLAGCAGAPARYLSAEEDAQLRKQCEPHGCAAVPMPIWQKIEQIMRALAGRST